jgi:hypothetical protein
MAYRHRIPWGNNGRVKSRYEVGCETCGLLETGPSWVWAFEHALIMAANHAICGPLCVFDSMARRGNTNLWILRNGHFEATGTK